MTDPEPYYVGPDFKRHFHKPGACAPSEVPGDSLACIIIDSDYPTRPDVGTPCGCRWHNSAHAYCYGSCGCNGPFPASG